MTVSRDSNVASIIMSTGEPGQSRVEEYCLQVKHDRVMDAHSNPVFHMTVPYV